MSQGLHQSSSLNTSGQELPRRTSLPYGLSATDWNPAWLPNDGFSWSSNPPQWVKKYSSSSCPATTFYVLSRPGSHVASNVVLCVIESTAFTRTLSHWGHLSFEFCQRFTGYTLLVQTQSGVFLPVDAFMGFVAGLQKTSSPYVSFEVQLLRPTLSLTLPATLPKWRRLLIKQFVRHQNSITSPLRLSFSPPDDNSTLCIYLVASESSYRATKFIVGVIDRLLSPDAIIMLDDLHVEGSYAPLVVKRLPALFRDQRLLRLQGLPPAHHVACALLSLCIKLPAGLVLDLSTPQAINTFVFWLPWILTSIPNDRHARPTEVYLFFKYDAVLGTKDSTLWSYLDNILAGHIFAVVTIASLEVDDMLDSKLKALLRVLLPNTQRMTGSRGSHSSVQMVRGTH